MQKGEALTNQLQELFPDLKVTGKGLMLGLHFPFDTSSLRRSLFESHHILVGNAKDKKVIRILPALTVEKEMLDQLVKALSVELNKINDHGSVLVAG